MSIVLALASGLARAQEPAADDFPAMQLRARLETHLQDRRDALAQAPAHYALVFELGQDQLLEVMRQVWPYWDGTAYVLGNELGAEPHGGGLLALLLDQWRPGSRAARLEDRFRFAANGRSLRLEELYRGYKRQIFLPVPGTRPEDLRGRLPESPRLPRMRFHYWTAPQPVETDAYKFLGLLIAHEPDPTATWRNDLGQQLSLDLLMRNVQGTYLSNRDPARALEDHTRLHLVELLLAFDRRKGDRAGAEEVKRRFLRVDLARRDFSGEAGTEALVHSVESLGLLLQEPGLTWRPGERRQVEDWLRWLERDRFHDLDAVRVEYLAHLLHGLRQIATCRVRLGQSHPAPGSGSEGRGSGIPGAPSLLESGSAGALARGPGRGDN